MERQEMEELVRLVMEQVMGRMATDPGSRGALEREKLLAVGPPERVPESVAKGCRICGLSDYEVCGDILAYRRVVITALTMAELADIAAGRDAGPSQKAVLQALLQGVEVYLCEEALAPSGLCRKGQQSALCGTGGVCQHLADVWCTSRLPVGAKAGVSGKASEISASGHACNKGKRLSQLCYGHY